MKKTRIADVNQLFQRHICWDCNGSGKRLFFFNCSTCNGSGYIYKHKSGFCDGIGYRPKQLDTKVYAPSKQPTPDYSKLPPPPNHPWWNNRRAGGGVDGNPMTPW